MPDLTGAPAEACANCRFFGGSPFQFCRHRSPVALLVGHNEQGKPVVSSYWPQTIPDGWCGDYERGAAPERKVVASADTIERALAGLATEGSA